MKKGTVILLNGTSSSGKSTIAEALQAVMDEPYLHTGIDHYLARLPKNLIVYSDGQTPSSAEGWLTVFKDRHLVDVILGPLGLRLIKGMYQAIAAFASAGNAVIVDDVIYDPRILSAAVNALRTIPVFFVGVQCPLDVAESRERARGDRAPGGARTFYNAVHAHKVYDFEVDTSLATPMECAVQIKEAMLNGVPWTAFNQLDEQIHA